MGTPRRDDRGRTGGAVAGGIAAGVLAGAMALGINMGILGAVGAPAGPGRLGAAPVVAVHRPPTDGPSIHRTSGHPTGTDRPVTGSPGDDAGSRSPSTPRPPRATRSGGDTEAPVDPTASAPSRPRPAPAGSEHPNDTEHEFGANDDD